ncbi:uncharacterized protein PV07_01848 [Cladophialophora immunda]|uniref:Uncharacterized protein n=1 Tax=Cladophialophora immunda TaxID=569365 RepID=A0A0D2CVK3_9EURO|nr:uncharacterized protein PV07_01848 [Cladophialophora immunda]KIW35133.1 hypothetical protein PV07_01848 [Cladophialophora immunda]
MGSELEGGARKKREASSTTAFFPRKRISQPPQISHQGFFLGSSLHFYSVLRVLLPYRRVWIPFGLGGLSPRCRRVDTNVSQTPFSRFESCFALSRLSTSALRRFFSRGFL